MKSKKSYLLIPGFIIIVIICYMIFSFMNIKDKTYDFVPGEFLIVTQSAEDNPNYLKDMQEDKEKIHKKLDEKGIEHNLFGVMVPEFYAYNDIDKEHMITYTILVGDDDFFKYHNVDVNEGINLYSYESGVYGELPLNFYENNDRNLQAVPFVFNASDTLKKENFPEFALPFSTIEVGDYITLSTFDTLKKEIPFISESPMRSYYLYVVAEPENMVTIYEEMQKLDFENIQISENAEYDPFESWYKQMMICAAVIIVLLIIEIIMYRKIKS